MKDASFANCLSGIFRQEVALARHHGCGNRAGIAAGDVIDPARQSVAGAIDCRGNRKLEARPMRRRYDIDAAEHIADGADAGKPRVTRKIIASGQAGMCGWHSRALSFT